MQDRNKTKEHLVVESAEIRQQTADMQQGHSLALSTRASSRILETTEPAFSSTQAEERQRLAIQVLEILNQSDKETDQIRKLLLSIQESTGLEAVGIRLSKNEDFPYYQTSGFPAYFVKAERYLCARNQAGELIRDAKGRPYLECMCGNVIRGRTDPCLSFFTQGGSFWSNGTTELLACTTEQERQAHTRNRCNGEGYESVALIPLRSDDEIIGLLQLNDSRKGMFTSEMIDFFEGIGASIGIALARKQMEEALRESEVRYRTLFEAAGDGIFLVQTSGRNPQFVDCNPRALDMFGCTREQILGKTPQEFSPPLQSDGRPSEEKAPEMIQAALKGAPQFFEWTHCRLDGTPFDTEVTLNCLGLGDELYVQGIVRDIAKRKRAEEMLRQLNHNLFLLNRVGQEFSSTLDQLQITEQLLQVITEIVGAEKASVWLWEEESHGDAAQSHGDAAQSHGDAAQDWLVCRAASPHGQGDSPFNMRVRPDQGVVGWVVRNGKSAIVPYARDDPRFFPGIDEQIGSRTLSLLAAPLWVRGKVIGVLEAVNKLKGSFDERDMTLLETLAASAAIAIDNAGLVEALQGYTAELQARNKDLDAYAHTVAHDLKGPLGHMVGFAQALEQAFAELPAEELRLYLRTISQSGYKMNSIIDELLLMAGLRKADVELDSLDMASVVDEALGRLASMIEENQVQILLPKSWPAALGYAPWVEEAWVNYLSNALKYGGSPPRVELGGEEQADGMVRFWVRDNGPGLTPEEQGRLFKSFERLDRVRAKGHGLGLSIVRRIVEKLGGKVGVESEVGQGSTFWFTLRRE